MLKRHLSSTELAKVLTEELTPEEKAPDRRDPLNMIKNFFKGNEHDDENESEKTV